MIFKIEYRIPEFKIPIIEYNLFSSYGVKKLILNHCRNNKVYYYIPANISDFEDYKYNPQNDYYFNDCLPSTYEDMVDLSVKDRKNEFNRNNMSLCESICTFKGYMNNYIICECNIKIQFNLFLNPNVSKYDSIYRFNTKEEHKTNIWVIKCLHLIFSKEIFLSNISSTIILAVLFFFIIGSIIFFAKENKIIYNKILMLMKFKYPNKENNRLNTNKNKNKNNIESNNDNNNDSDNDNNNNDNINKEVIYNKKNGMKHLKRNKFINQFNMKSSKRTLQSNLKSSFSGNRKAKKSKGNIFKILGNKKKIEEDDVYGDMTYNELNSLSYQDALVFDQRTLSQYYISIIMTKQLLAFTFHCKNDYNSKIMKIGFLLYIIVIYLVVNTLFIDVSALYQLFISQGYIGILYDPIKIILTTLVSLAIKNILFYIVFTEENIVSLRNLNFIPNRARIKTVMTIITLKFHLFFVLGIFSLIFFWVYIASFFTIFKKTQIFVIRNSLISFGISMVIPIILGVIPSSLRQAALANREKKNKLCFYLTTKIIQTLI